MIHTFKKNLVEQELESQRRQIQQNQDNEKKRWVALLDSNPIQHVIDFNWLNLLMTYLYGGATGPPLVNIGGLWGTVCYDGFDENAANFFCQKLYPGFHVAGSVNGSISHEELEMYGTYPVLLTDVQCNENAQSVDDCTSGPMGYDNCASGNDVLISCGVGTPITPPPISS